MLKECKVLLGLTLTVFLFFFTGCGDMFDFSTETPATPATPDTTKPSVTSQTSDGALVTTPVSASFSENVNIGGFSVSGVSGTVSGNGTSTISFTPSRRLDYGTTYTATISNVRDGAGNSAGDVSWSFTTASLSSLSFIVHTTPDWPNNIGQYNSIAISPVEEISPVNGKKYFRKYITYTDSIANTLKIISTLDGTSWDGPTTIVTSPLGRSSMAIDSAGIRHVVYLQQGSPNNVIYTSSSAGFAPTILTTTTGTDIYPDITVDKDNKVHISFYSNKALRYTYNDGSWHLPPTPVDLGAVGVDDPGYYTSIGVDGSGIVHISYYDQANENLKYAQPGKIMLTEPGCDPNWDCYTLDSTGDVGKYSSLALSPSDEDIHITYYDDTTNKKIKLITHSVSFNTWKSLALFSVSGETTCPLVIDDDGIMHMSYISSDSSGVFHLYYASKSYSWSQTAIDPDGIDTLTSIGNGVYTSIAVDSNGKVYISYRDETDSDLKYAHPIY